MHCLLTLFQGRFMLCLEVWAGICNVLWTGTRLQGQILAHRFKLLFVHESLEYLLGQGKQCWDMSRLGGRKDF